MNPLKERTLILVKPDGVRRALIGEVIARFERVGLKVFGIKMVNPDRAFIEKHYPSSKEWTVGLGQKSLSDYEQYNLDPVEQVGTKDPYEVGKLVTGWLFDYMSSGPSVAIVFEGNQAVAMGRKIVGNTIPSFAPTGTIRGDFAKDSPILANLRKRGVKNVVHASGSIEEA